MIVHDDPEFFTPILSDPKFEIGETYRDVMWDFYLLSFAGGCQMQLSLAENQLNAWSLVNTAHKKSGAGKLISDI